MQYERECWNNGYVSVVEEMASRNAVVIFSNNTCCMCHAIKKLLCGMGVNPTVYELDDYNPTWQQALFTLLADNSLNLPVVFIGGKLLGSMDTILTAHINGTLVPLLKEAGALWL